MLCYIRLMHKEDISQVNEIDREAFFPLWPSPNYQRELQNRLAHYIVAYDENETAQETEVPPPPANSLSRLKVMVGRLFDKGRSSGSQFIKGFAGFWIMASEAHVTNIAVREAHRRQGIGELLLISVIGLAIELKASKITLEVRASNTAAQNLYYKYGFLQTGIRHNYYTDNKEDGILMSTDDISSASFQSHHLYLKQSHSAKWTVALQVPDLHSKSPHLS